MKWIDLETVLEIHNRVIESTGGSYGLRTKIKLRQKTVEQGFYN